MGGGGVKQVTAAKIPYDVLKKRIWSEYMSKNMLSWNPFTDAVRATLHEIAQDPTKDAEAKYALLVAQTKQVVDESHRIHDEYMHKLTKGFILNECDSLGIDLVKILDAANQEKEAKRAKANEKRKATKQRRGTKKNA
jgi:hypothetical protein